MITGFFSPEYQESFVKIAAGVLLDGMAALQNLTAADPRRLGPQEYKDLFCDFLYKGPHRYLRAIQDILLADDDVRHYALDINAMDVVEYNPQLGYMLLQHPALLLPIFEEAVLRVQTFVAAATTAAPQDYQSSQEAKSHVHVRVSHLPPVHELHKPNISSIRASDVGKLIQVTGTVIRVGAVKMLNASKEYVCRSQRCGHTFRVYADMEQGYLLQPPKICPRDGCNSTELAENKDGDECSDYQEIKIQDQVQNLGVGSIPRSLLVILEDDLVDTCKPGDDVVIVGLLVRKWRPVSKERRCDVDVVLRSTSVRMASTSLTVNGAALEEEARQEFLRFWTAHQGRPIWGRNVIVKSVCPQIYGLLMVKLAILLTVIGGVDQAAAAAAAAAAEGAAAADMATQVEDDDTIMGSNVKANQGLRVRSQPHLLLVGDPGTGKSQFLRFASRLVPRTVLTTGIGTTNAGLTCSAVRDGTEWVLEAGALVLADRGLCCIDEFSSIREHDRTAIHEAMEQQTLSIAKAGLVCKLNARASVIAVTNPKAPLERGIGGGMDIAQDITVHTAIGAPLLSRFDLILVLMDKGVDDWDRSVSSFILGLQDSCVSDAGDSMAEDDLVIKGGEGSMGEGEIGLERASGEGGGRCVAGGGGGEGDGVWSLEQLQRYVSFVKENFHPDLSPEAMEVLEQYYKRQRRSEQRSVALSTIRLLESLIRLSEAHARLMCRDKVTLTDAVVAVMLVECSRRSFASGILQDALDFHRVPLDPDEDLRLQTEQLLQRLRAG